MKTQPGLLVMLGGLAMMAAFFLPWGQAAFMGMHHPTFSAADLAERDPGWNIVLVCAMFTTLAGMMGLWFSVRDRARPMLMAGASGLMFSLIALMFVLRVLSRLSGAGVSVGWIEGATAEDLELAYQWGLWAELAGCALAASGAIWLVRLAKRGLK